MAARPDELATAHGLMLPATRPQIPGGGPQSVARILDPVCAAHPEREALVGRSGRYTYARLDREVDRAASALQQLGVEQGDRVAACLPNDVDIVIAFLAVQRLAAIWVGINRPLAPPEKAYLLGDSGARVYLVAPDLADELAGERAALDALEHQLVVDPACPDHGLRGALGAAPDASASLPELSELPEPDPFAPAAIAYTSGTTGFPKGAVHSQHNMLLPGAVSALGGRFESDVRQGAVLPLTILNLMILEPLAAFYAGRCCVCVDRIDPVGLAAWIRDEQVGAFSGVPTIFHDLLTHPDVAPNDLRSLRHPGCGGSDVAPELVALYRERFGKEMGIGYGMTEAPTAVAWSDGSVPSSPGLCGRAAAQVEIEIRAEDGALKSVGELGEICVRAARSGPLAGVYTPMLGYWNRSEASAAALQGGVYHTGDLGLLAEDGNLYIRGRRNELILRGGANVYPAEVERVLVEHPDVATAAVFGVADARLGERVVAVAQPVAGRSVDAESLVEFAGKRLARYKVPERVAFADEMPRNAMGKVVKSVLRERYFGDASRR